MFVFNFIYRIKPKCINIIYGAGGIIEINNSNHRVCYEIYGLQIVSLSLWLICSLSLFFLGGQSIGVSASSVLPMNTQDCSSLGWTGWISLQTKGLSRVSPTPQFKSINSSVLSFVYSPTLTSIHDHGKTIALTRWTFVDKVMSLLLNILLRLVITFLPRSKRLLISWL